MTQKNVNTVIYLRLFVHQTIRAKNKKRHFG